MIQEDSRLDEFNEDEWWDVCKTLKPQITREEFSRLWAEFIEVKKQHQAKASLN